MSDLTTIGTAALAAIADGDVHWAAEAIVAFDSLLTHNGWVIVALALVAAFYRCGMAWIMRQGTPKRRAADAPAVVVNTAPPPVAPSPPPAPPHLPDGKRGGENKELGFRGLYPQRRPWVPPSVRHYPQFPIDGEIPIITRERGGAVIVDENQCAVVLLTVPPDFVCDQSSTPDLAARLFDVMKSDMSPQGIFHDAMYRYGVPPIAAMIRFREMKKAYAFARRMRKRAVDLWLDPAFVKSVGGKLWKPDQQWADDAFRALLLVFNAEVLKRRSRKKAWAAVRLFGEESFRDPAMARKCAEIKRKIRLLE